MNSFLSYVAQDIIQKYGSNLSDIAIVFPNKRASLFLNEHLARLVERPLWSPNYITISELFRNHSSLKVADPIKLVCDLHKSFVACTGIQESLDHFYGWGQLLLADFDDIDKNMADAKQLFSNMTNLHELDDISYLTDEQKAMIKKFFSNFSDDHNSELKKRFLQLWSHFHDIHAQFNERLTSQGLAYEGALYRLVAEDENIVFKHKKYLFVGFNMMQQVEQRLCLRLMKAGKAAFYWDYDTYYVKGHNEAGHYIRQYLKLFPNELSEYTQQEIYNNLSSKKEITYLSASTENIQARYIYTWLMENERYRCGRKTAIVLADESLLPTVIHSLPKAIDKVNITLGYPLQQTPFYSLVQQLIALQTIGHRRDTDTYRLHYVLQALSHPYAKYISKESASVAEELKQQKLFFPTRQWLHHDSEDLSLLFSSLEGEASFTLALTNYLLEILKTIGTHARQEDNPLFQESLFRTYTLLNRLQELIQCGDLDVDVITLERLIVQLMQSTNIPFHGEPAEGIQIMGVLETRNLDFDHVLVLSCEEGNLPKGVNDSSFIPYSLRKAYGLTTIDNKVAIYSYYFHSMIQRASDICFAYSNATDNGQSKEMSRFMLQLLVESPHAIKRQTLTAGQSPVPHNYDDIEKTEQMIEPLFANKVISPTFLNTYQRCPKRFYYRYVKGLKEPEEMEEEIDNRIFGNIFHKAAQLFYLKFAKPSNLTTQKDGEQQLIHPIIIGKDEIEFYLKHDTELYRIVDEAFREDFFHIKNGGKLPEYNGLQYINREVITDYLKQLLRIDSRLAPFTIHGLELKVQKTFDIDTPLGKKKITLGGIIDRLDSITSHGNGSTMPERMRVIDYKTGRKPQSFPTDIDALFCTDSLNKHSDYYLQAILYSLIVGNDAQINGAQYPVSPALIFIQQAGASDFDPTLTLGREPIVDANIYKEEFTQGLHQLISEICDPSVPFSATTDKKRCGTCPYAALCR